MIRKVFPEAFAAQNPDLVDGAFRHLATLWHPQLARILDFGWEDGKIYLVREYMEGKPFLEACAGASLPQILSMVAQILVALDFLFSRNVWHLHLKPENIWVEPGASGPQVKLTDYGLMPWLYPPGQIESGPVGTPPYTAPEYALHRALDVRADLYSMGVLLYAALARRPPFNGKVPVEIFQAQSLQDPPPLQSVAKGLPPKLSPFVQALMARDSQDRPASPRAALLGLMEAAGSLLPADAVPWPPLLSDPDDVFAYPEALKLFRRITLQGGRWAIFAEPGGGKTFLARWMQRLFWLHRKRVAWMDGAVLGLMHGEALLHPSEPTYLLIDDADQGPTEAWLRARSYPHVVAFGSRMPWAKKPGGKWKGHEWKALEMDQVGTLLRRDLRSLDPRVLQEWMERTQGVPQALVQHGRALAREGIVRRQGEAETLDAEKYLKASSSAQASHFAAVDSGYAELQKKMLRSLHFTRVPWQASVLAAGLGVSVPEIAAALPLLIREEAVERLLWRGREYFRSALSGVALEPLSDAEAQAWILLMSEEGWHRDALEAFDRHFSPSALQEPVLTLLRAKLISAIGAHASVLGLVTAPFVGSLSADLKGDAFETLGKALLVLGKAKQADAAFRNALKCHQQNQNLAGSARALLHLGVLFDKVGQGAKALELFQQAYQAAASVGHALTPVIDLQVASFYMAATDFDQAEARFQSCLEALEALQKEELLAQAYAAYALFCLSLGDRERAEYYVREGLSLALFKRDFPTQGTLFLLGAKLEESHDNWSGVLEKLSSAVTVLGQAPLSALYLQALAERAYLYEVKRQLPLAKRDAEEILLKARSFKEASCEAQAHLVLGKILRRDPDRFAGAMEHLDLARQGFEKAPQLLRAWECEYERGEIERRRGDRAAALACFAQALEMLDRALMKAPSGSLEAGILMQKKRQVEVAKSNT